MGTSTASPFTVVHCTIEWRVSMLPGPEVLGEEPKQWGRTGKLVFWCESSSLKTCKIRKLTLFFCLDWVAFSCNLEIYKNLGLATPSLHVSTKPAVDTYLLYILEVITPNSFQDDDPKLSLGSWEVWHLLTHADLVPCSLCSSSNSAPFILEHPKIFSPPPPDWSQLSLPQDAFQDLPDKAIYYYVLSQQLVSLLHLLSIAVILIGVGAFNGCLPNFPGCVAHESSRCLCFIHYILLNS